MQTSERDDATAEIRVVPVAEVPWADVRAVFGVRGDPATCWCQWFKLSGTGWRDADAGACESALREQTEHGPGPGLVAYLDDEPVGWVAVEPRPAYPRLRTTRVVAKGSTESQDDPSVWSVTCFVVRVGFRRRGIGAALLRAAVAHAEASGARVLEGYPVDPTEKKASAAALYHGALSPFLAEGFEIVSRPETGRAVVRLAF
ncbi:GNAT family N-acetyltransferase [Planctomonas sp. JC2975]|uniref:GNAT family N-acetyltransferase n=1 Tax=Planctomonas sp. JC2975 TaxID=2729626 RepID=UPI001472E435|nr:GNAT family N-acetyltransferase [Planctomonas sp. JC2975]NNC10292.1 GNAT family N-acetyltransferase [Planctomonas sp. JC2975]